MVILVIGMAYAQGSLAPIRCLYDVILSRYSWPPEGPLDGTSGHCRFWFCRGTIAELLIVIGTKPTEAVYEGQAHRGSLGAGSSGQTCSPVILCRVISAERFGEDLICS